MSMRFSDHVARIRGIEIVTNICLEKLKRICFSRRHRIGWEVTARLSLIEMLSESVFCIQLGRGKALVNTAMGPWVSEKTGNFSVCQEWFYIIELVASNCI